MDPQPCRGQGQDAGLQHPSPSIPPASIQASPQAMPQAPPQASPRASPEPWWGGQRGSGGPTLGAPRVETAQGNILGMLQGVHAPRGKQDPEVSLAGMLRRWTPPQRWPREAEEGPVPQQDPSLSLSSGRPRAAAWPGGPGGPALPSPPLIPSSLRLSHYSDICARHVPGRSNLLRRN